MRIPALVGVMVLAAACSGCAGAAKPIGTAAGELIGGTAWVTSKGAKLAFKGGKFAAKTTGRTVVGAARGVHEEFSKPEGASAAQTAAAQTPAAQGGAAKTAAARTGQVSQLSQSQRAALAN